MIPTTQLPGHQLQPPSKLVQEIVQYPTPATGKYQCVYSAKEHIPHMLVKLSQTIRSGLRLLRELIYASIAWHTTRCHSVSQSFVVRNARKGTTPPCAIVNRHPQNPHRIRRLITIHQVLRQLLQGCEHHRQSPLAYSKQQ